MPIKQAEALRIEQLHYEHENGPGSILSNISMTVKAGEWVSIVGKNGSGKSTLAKLIMGLLPISRGDIYIADELLTEENVYDVRQGMGYIQANPDDQFVGLTVADDLAFGLENLKMDWQEMNDRVNSIAEQLQITALLQRHPATLSGGQKQRVALASVLAMEPRFIIFDEALSMLDERSKAELLEMLQYLSREQHYTFISITHELDEILVTDRMIALAGGNIIAEGTPDQLLKNEAVLKQCNLEMPYPLQLCRKLQEQGLAIEDYVRVEEVQRALWDLYSKKSPSLI